MALVVLCGQMPFTLTIDTDSEEITEFLVDVYSPLLDETQIETRAGGDEIDDPDLLRKAVKIANDAEWPQMEEM